MVAECISYYNVATTNEWWAAVEVIVDGVAFVVMIPGAFYLTYVQWGKAWNSGKVYTVVLAITTILYPYFNFTKDAPMYLKRYAADQAAHKKYFPFWDGIKDATMRRVVTHKTEDWEDDFLWMTIYFTIAAWSGLLLMWAPRSAPSLDALEAECHHHGEPGLDHASPLGYRDDGELQGYFVLSAHETPY